MATAHEQTGNSNTLMSGSNYVHKMLVSYENPSSPIFPSQCPLRHEAQATRAQLEIHSYPTRKTL